MIDFLLGGFLVLCVWAYVQHQQNEDEIARHNGWESDKHFRKMAKKRGLI